MIDYATTLPKGHTEVQGNRDGHSVINEEDWEIVSHGDAEEKWRENEEHEGSHRNCGNVSITLNLGQRKLNLFSCEWHSTIDIRHPDDCDCTSRVSSEHFEG